MTSDDDRHKISISIVNNFFEDPEVAVLSPI